MERRQLSAVLGWALAAVLVLALPIGAEASTRLGPDLSVPPVGSLGGVESSSPSSYVNVSSTNPDVVAASPIDGVVTKWRFRAYCCNPAQSVSRTLTLKTFRYLGASGGFVELEPVATGPSLTLPPGNTLSADAPTEMPARLPIAAGERVGIVADYPTMFSTYTSPNVISTVLANGFKKGFAYNGSIAVNAEVEPDADRDGYGDETQDCQPSDPNQHEACAPTFPPPPPPIPPSFIPDPRCQKECDTGTKMVSLGRPPQPISTPRGDGGIVVPLSCPRNSTANCTGILYMTLAGGKSARISAAAPSALVKKPYSLKPGAKKDLRLVFSKKLKAFLAEKRTRKVIITVKPDGGPTLTKTMTLRFPKPK